MKITFNWNSIESYNNYRDNIKYGNIRNATDEDVITAAKLASLHDRIESFPNKYDTEVKGLKFEGNI